LGDDEKMGQRKESRAYGKGSDLGTGSMSEIRVRLSAHTKAIMMSLILYSEGALGRAEIQLNN